MATLGRPETALSLVSPSPSEVELRGALYRGLWSYNSEWQLVPVIAEAVPTLGDGSLSFPDGKRRISVRVRREEEKPVYFWSDGTPVKGSDYLTAFQLTTSLPLLANRQPEWRQTVASVQCSGDLLEVQFVSMWPDAGLEWPPFPTSLGDSGLIAGGMSRLTREYGRRPLCNGPYFIERWEGDGRLIQLKANPHFPWPEAGPPIPRIELRGYDRPERLIRALVRRDVQLAPRIPLRLLGELTSVPDLTTRSVVSTNLKTLILRTDAPVLRDVRVRRAIFAGLQRNDWVGQVHPEVTVEPARSWLPEQAGAYRPVLIDLEDPQTAHREAERLLAEAGFTGKAPRRKGRLELKLELMYDADSEVDGVIVAHLAHYCEQIGIVLDPKPVRSELLASRLQRRNFPHMALTNQPLTPWLNPARLFSNRYLPELRADGRNYSGWADPKNERLCELIEAAPDPESRDAALELQQDYFASELPFIPLYFVPELHAVHRTVVGYRPTGFGPTTWNVETWKLDAKAVPVVDPSLHPPVPTPGAGTSGTPLETPASATPGPPLTTPATPTAGTTPAATTTPSATPAAATPAGRSSAPTPNRTPRAEPPAR
ncbi:MAG: ABC transporter substrate-binding protein [Candidatus Eremiobacterota bacterium]